MTHKHRTKLFRFGKKGYTFICVRRRCGFQFTRSKADFWA